jgi:hypothetical protein
VAENQVLTARHGQTKAWAIGPIVDSSGAQVATFTAGDIPTASLYKGDDEAAACAPSVAWVQTSAPASLALTVTPADATAPALAAQPYPLEVWIAHGGQQLLAWEGWLDLLPASGGTAAALPVYGGFADMLDVAGPWIKDLLFAGGSAGFVRQRARARSRLDEVILRRWRPRQLGYRLDLTLGLGGFWLPEAQNPTLASYLASNFLIVRPLVVEVVSHLAVAYAARRNIGGDGKYQDKYAYHWAEANRLMLGLVAEIDVNGDGLADFTVNLGVINTRSVY